MGMAGDDERLELGIHDEWIRVRRGVAGVVGASRYSGPGAAGDRTVEGRPEWAEMVVCSLAGNQLGGNFTGGLSADE